MILALQYIVAPCHFAFEHILEFTHAAHLGLATVH